MAEDTNPGEFTGLEIAIVGLAGRFPGARTVEQFWQNLCDGVEAVRFFSDQELLDAGVDPELLRDPAYVRAGVVLDDIDRFDAAFFGITPREAEVLDPQQRLFLECAWEALERAGYAPERYRGSIGLFAGSRISSYMLRNLASRPDVTEAVGSYQTLLGNDKDFLTTRVSYKLNLRGPSLSVSTACSTSLVAVHLACQSLISGACDMALAGGVAVALPQGQGYRAQEGGILAPDGHCRAFDARAQGTLGGNGLGVVVLKRLEDALADRDHIHAVIKGSAINNDGAGKVGFTAPSVEGQAEAVRSAHLMAEVEPETIGYIEAHGTGTALGDPIEVAALTQVFRDQTDQTGFCAIGSLKTNIGHLDAAAGVAGLIKAALTVEHGQIPPSLHFEQPNPRIDFASSPFYVNAKLSAWERQDGPRRAGVSSFGIGGTNAHVVLEETPARADSGPSRPWQLLLLSAQTPAALDQASAELAAHLRRHPEQSLADAAYTLQVGRRAFEQRRALVARDSADAAEALAALDPQRVTTQQSGPAERPVVFLCSGQGSQYAGMGRELYETEPVFREQIDRCAELLRPHLGLDIRPLLFEQPDERRTTNDEGVSSITPTTGGEASTILNSQFSILNSTTGGGASTILNAQFSMLNSTAYAQPALFAIEYALAQLWMSWGVRPAALIGHSIGEYVAATLAEVFTLEDALAVVAARGRMMQALPAGAMLSVPLPEEELRPLLGAELGLAAVNTPARCVVSGPEEQIAALERRLAERQITGRRLHTSHAFHSPMMEPIVGPFTALLRGVKLRAPKLPFVSNVTGAWITAAEATDPAYWARHLRQAVRFADGLREIAQQPGRVLLEIGPGTTLTLLARPQLDPAVHTVLPSLRHPQDQQSDAAFLLQTLGRLWLEGVAVDWEAFSAGEQRRRCPLPTYPFERKRYWVDPAPRPRQAAPAPETPAQIPAQAPVPAPAPSLAPTPVTAPVAQATADDETAVEKIIAMQLEVMAQQFAYLKEMS